MRLFCQYSKINFSTSAMLGANLNDPVTCVHPIFYAPVEYLEKLYKAWQEGKLPDKRDQRLLFLAMLNATDHIDWYHHADPKPAVVCKYMEAMYDHMLWMTDVMLPSLKLPRYAINEHTVKLDNIGNWLNCWTNIREEFDRGYTSRSEQEKAARKKMALDLLATTKNADDGSKQRRLAYLRTLADWAALALQFPAELTEYWKLIIRCQTALAALDFRPVDVEELLEHITVYGDYDSTHYFALLKHVKQVLEDAKGTSVSNLNFADLIADGPAPFRLPSTTTEAVNVANQVALAPAAKPLRADYPSSLAYNIALARWNLVQVYK